MKRPTNEEKRDRKFILLFPVFSGLTVFIVFLIFRPFSMNFVDKHMIDDYETFLGIWGTLLGFFITVVSIFLTLGKESAYMNMLKETGHFDTVLYAYALCCIHLFIAISLALIVVLFEILHYCFFILLIAFAFDILISVGMCLFFLFFMILRV